MSRVRPTVLPDIPASMDREFADAVREILEVGVNRRGDPRDSFVTVRMLADAGIVDDPVLGGLSGGGRRLGNPDGAGGSPIFLNPTTPGTNPLPTGHLNLRTKAVWDGIMLQWDWPPGNIEYSATQIWAAKQVEPDVIPLFEQALLVGNSAGNLFVHENLGLGAVWFYWLRYVGFAPTSGSAPPYSAYTPPISGRGVRGETAIDPEYVLGVLEGQIGNDQLALGLANRIDLVDFYYDASGAKVPVPRVEVFDNDGNPTGLMVQNVQNRVLAAVRDVNSDFQIAIAQEAAIRGSADDVISAAYSIKIDIGGYVTGFGLIATRTDNGDLIPATFDSAFVVRANRFAVIFPDIPGAPVGPPVVPFVVGLVNGVPTTGINGALVVDGTLTATAIQAGTIGAREINATSIWAGVVSADRVFSSTFATSGDLNWRVEIDGGGLYPFWYGQGVKGGANSVFYFDRFGNTHLAGNLIVSGGGQFSTAGGAGDARVEIGGNNGYVLWAGTGATNDANGVFYVTLDGTPYIRGAPISLPVGSNSSNGQPTCGLTVVRVPGRATVPVQVQAFAGISAGSALFEKTIKVSFLINGVESYVAFFSTQDYVFPCHALTIFNLAQGDYTFTMAVAVVATGGGNSTPAVTYGSGSMIALQLAAVTA